MFAKYRSIIKSFLPQWIIKKLTRRKKRDQEIRLYVNGAKVLIDTKHGVFDGCVATFYWDDIENFGDAIGPYIISKLTGRPVFNVLDTKSPGLMTVGSILQIIDRKGMVVWGTGLIAQLDNATRRRILKYRPTILSVRGYETAKELERIGIGAPRAVSYGDPALILPMIFTPTETRVKKIALVPHYIHKTIFKLRKGDSVVIVDVQRNVEAVVNDICSASICISSSLHGLIIAQAYKIPWVWLELTDKSLAGSDFKFKDFFSTLDDEDVPHIKTTSLEAPMLDLHVIAEKAKLPKSKYNPKLILKEIQDHLKHAC